MTLKRPSYDLYGPSEAEPVGPGDPECLHCKGDGVIAVEQDTEHRHPPSYRRCKCVLYKDIIANVERGMKGLSKAPAIKTSPLLKEKNESLWLTASPAWLCAHLRHVAIRQPPTWYFKVISDVDLMTAWLASAALKGKEILDPDAAKVSLEHLTLVDLIVPPQLLIIRVGVKAARNVATPEVLLETLIHREHLGLPTWVWDQPGWRLEGHHNAYSEDVGRYLSSWDHMVVSGNDPKANPQKKGGFTEWMPAGRTSTTLSSASSPSATGSSSFLEEQAKEASNPWPKRPHKPPKKSSPPKRRQPEESSDEDDDEIADLLGASKTLSLYNEDK